MIGIPAVFPENLVLSIIAANIKDKDFSNVRVDLIH